MAIDPNMTCKKVISCIWVSTGYFESGSGLAWQSFIGMFAPGCCGDGVGLEIIFLFDVTEVFL